MGRDDSEQRRAEAIEEAKRERERALRDEEARIEAERKAAEREKPKDR